MMATKMKMVLVLLFFAGSAAMAQDLKCSNGLTPCQPYVGNSTITPSEDCCSGIKDTFKTNLTCWCDLLKNDALLKSCGITSGVEACNSVATNGASPTPPNKDGASSIAWMGMSGLVTLFLFFWSIIG